MLKTCLFLCLLAACGGDDDDGSAGACTGSFTDCKMGELSDTQLDEFCTVALQTSGATPGTVTTCDDGTEVTIETAAMCVANFKANNRCPAFANLSAGTNLDCAVDAFAHPCSLIDGSSQACQAAIQALASCN